VSKRKRKAEVLVPGQWLLATHDGRQVFVPNPDHECPDLQKDKSKDKSKKAIFKSNKFKKQIKKSLMATWEDLDNESDSDEEDVEDEAKIAMALVATDEGCIHIWE